MDVLIRYINKAHHLQLAEPKNNKLTLKALVMRPFLVIEDFRTLLQNPLNMNKNYVEELMQHMKAALRPHQYQHHFNTIWPLGIKKINGDIVWALVEIEVI